MTPAAGYRALRDSAGNLGGPIPGKPPAIVTR